MLDAGMPRTLVEREAIPFGRPSSPARRTRLIAAAEFLYRRFPRLEVVAPAENFWSVMTRRWS